MGWWMAKRRENGNEGATASSRIACGSTSPNYKNETDREKWSVYGGFYRIKYTCCYFAAWFVFKICVLFLFRWLLRSQVNVVSVIVRSYTHTHKQHEIRQKQWWCKWNLFWHDWHECFVEIIYALLIFYVYRSKHCLPFSCPQFKLLFQLDMNCVYVHFTWIHR